MKRRLENSQWLDRFTIRLMVLLPTLSLVEARRRASETVVEASDLEPEEAADIFASELPPVDAGSPGD